MSTRKSPSAETLAFVDLLDGYVRDALDDSPLHRRLQATLSPLDPDRSKTRKIVAAFKKKLARTSKRKVDGGRALRAFRWGKFRSLDEASLKRLLAPKAVFHLREDDIGAVTVPRFPPNTKFTIKYKGLHCKSESRDRNNPWGSDEPYVLTSAVTVVDGENVVRTEMHPIGAPRKYYGDVDNNEVRNGPIAACWHGSLSEVSLVVTVMEHDEGDQEHYREEVDLLVKTAAAIALYFGYPIPDFLQQLASNIIIYLTGSEDDNMGMDTVIFTGRDLRALSQQPGLNRVGNNRTLPFEYHRSSFHDDGAKYYAFFSVEADREPIVPPAPDGGPIAGGVARPVRVLDPTLITF